MPLAAVVQNCPPVTCGGSRVWSRLPAGAANAGVPLAAIVQNYGWDAYFIALIASCVVTVLLVLPMARLKSYSQTVAKTA